MRVGQLRPFGHCDEARSIVWSGCTIVVDRSPVSLSQGAATHVGPFRWRLGLGSGTLSARHLWGARPLEGALGIRGLGFALRTGVVQEPIRWS
jgi:hypothetical protein